MEHTININMDKKCSKCGDAGAMDSGLCLKCRTDEVIAGKSGGPTREFKKIKVDLATKFLELTYTETILIGDDVIETEYEAVRRKLEVHADLIAAMQNFIPHMLILTEMFDGTEFSGADMIAFDRKAFPVVMKFDVSSISTGGSDEHAGLTISGRKTLRGGKVFNINSPFTKYEGGEHEDHYAYGSDMARAFDLLEKEVNLFLDEGKAAPKKQLEMDLKAA